MGLLLGAAARRRCRPPVARGRLAWLELPWPFGGVHGGRRHSFSFALFRGLKLWAQTARDLYLLTPAQPPVGLGSPGGAREPAYLTSFQVTGDRVPFITGLLRTRFGLTRLALLREKRNGLA